MVKRIVVGLALVALVLKFAWFVWPTPYRYFDLQVGGDKTVVRENRFTGRLSWLLLNGRECEWREPEPPK
jgi:hypothetical protein